MPTCLSAHAGCCRYGLHHEIAAAAEATDPDPTDKQRNVGNYAKGKVSVHGLTVSIESPRGSIRSGVDSQGEPWSVELRHHYGYINRTKSKADGDHVDVFLGPHPDSEVVFIIDQTKAPGWRNFDEHKVMLGWKSAAAAKDAYLANYSAGWKGFDGITVVTIDQFKQWLADGDTSRRASEQFPALRERFARAFAHRGWPERYRASPSARWVTIGGGRSGDKEHVGGREIERYADRYAIWRRLRALVAGLNAEFRRRGFAVRQ